MWIIGNVGSLDGIIKQQRVSDYRIHFQSSHITAQYLTFHTCTHTSHTLTHSHTHTSHSRRVHMPSVTYLRLDGSVAPNARFGIVQK